MKIIYKNGTGMIEEKKSRFIANVYKVTSEEEAVSIINSIKKQYWDARHNCYAYVIGEKKELQRFSDDGEPQGTAGKPILEIILKENIYDCLIIVTRYFGGTLLGTGGLIRAYQSSTKEGIADSIVMEVIEGVSASIRCDYNSIGKIQYICGQMDISVMDTDYLENVNMKMIMKKEKYEQFVNKITDAFSGKIEVVKNGQQKFGKSKEGEIILL